MHYATMRSKRLRAVREFLRDGKPRSTREIIHGAGVCAVNSAISELRRNGHEIRCYRVGDVFFYKMKGAK